MRLICLLCLCPLYFEHVKLFSQSFETGHYLYTYETANSIMITFGLITPRWTPIKVSCLSKWMNEYRGASIDKIIPFYEIYGFYFDFINQNQVLPMISRTISIIFYQLICRINVQSSYKEKNPQHLNYCNTVVEPPSPIIRGTCTSFLLSAIKTHWLLSRINLKISRRNSKHCL